MPNLRRLINQDYDSQSHMSHGPRSTVRSSQASQFINSVPRLLIPTGRRSPLISQSDFNDLERGSQFGDEQQAAMQVRSKDGYVAERPNLPYDKFKQMMLDQNRLNGLEI